MTPKLVALQSWKKLQVLEKTSFQLICTYETYKTECRNFLKIIRSRDMSLSLIFCFQKTFLHHKIITKTRSTKNQGNSAHCFGDNYLTNHLVKFMQDRLKSWRVGALRVCTGYHFFLTKIVSEGFPTSFSFSCCFRRC